MSGVRVVGTPITCAGFALSGLPTHEVPDAREAATAIEGIVAQGAADVLLVEQPLLDGLDPAVERKLMRRTVPLIVPFPGPQRHEAEEVPESLVQQLLQRAIGYRVRL